ncbi:MAG: rhomboid family intramembrane serine protease [Sedimentisphaerales bacterium]|nr:rhomboid family intramembrane serine protease [Sedimentisphaerales bacterium]
MGFQDRPYYREPDAYGPAPAGIRLARPPLTPMVKYLLIANIVVFVLQILFRNPEKYFPFPGALEYYFSATTLWNHSAWQIWRLLTFQFLHDSSSPFHLLFNMIGLYFLGTVLERSWGSRRFLLFYLVCGAVGGLLYVLASVTKLLSPGLLVGASGGVLGLLVACAILFPQMMVILILFPMSIRTAALLLTAVYVLMVLTGGRNAGGDLCHLGGMATALVWIIGRPYLAARLGRRRQRAYSDRLEEKRAIQFEVDRILSKVHDEGIHSLTRKEKQILQKATECQKR